MAELYTDQLNGATTSELKSKEDELLFASIFPLMHIEMRESEVKCLKLLQGLMLKGSGVFSVLNRFSRGMLSNQDYVEFKPTPYQIAQTLKEIMKRLSTKTNDQTFALASDNYWSVFQQRSIVLSRGFEFVETNLGPKGMLNYDLLLPFENKNHVDDGCVAGKDLPPFYSKKGRDNI